jgi:hypothetical protein
LLREEKLAVNLDDLYDRAFDQATHVDQTFLELGESLRRLHNRDKDLYQKLVERSGLGTRKAYYLLEISRRLERIPGIPKSRLRALGWTKLATIAKQLTPKNVEKLLTLAENNSVRDLEALARGERPKGDNTHCVQMYFTPGQYEIFASRILENGAYRSGRGILNKEEALIKILSDIPEEGEGTSAAGRGTQRST